MYEKHGMRKTRLYSIWAGMKARCYIESATSYENYGARGIKICEEWRESFLAFANWANSNGYAENLTIERNYNNGDYCPENCTWVLKSEQSKNRRNNRYIEIDGITKTLAEWAMETGLGPDTIDMRIKKGFRKNDVLGKPQKNLVTIEGVTKPIETWAKENNLCSHVIRRRIKKGYSGKVLILPKGEFNAIEKSMRTCS